MKIIIFRKNEQSPVEITPAIKLYVHILKDSNKAIKEETEAYSNWYKGYQPRNVDGINTNRRQP